MRMTLGVLVGLLLAAGVLVGCGYLLPELHPFQAGFDPRTLLQFSPRAQYDLTKYIEAAPPEALILICVAAGAAALIGAWPAARIARGHRGGAALFIAAPLTLLVIISAALVPQPSWVPVLGMLLPIPLAVAAWRLAIPRAEL